MTHTPAEFSALLKILSEAWNGLPDKPDETPESTLRALWQHAAGMPSSVEPLAREAVPSLSEQERVTLRALVTRRICGVPLAHLTGQQEFMGIKLLAGPEAMIPRKETEILGYAALAKLKEMAGRQPGLEVIDLCTGSGNLALALASQVQGCQMYGADLSEKAVELAKRNAIHLGLAERVKFTCGDLFQPFESPAFYNQIDMVVCNPPYISHGKLAALPDEIGLYEPALAFDGGPFGMSVLGRLVADAPRFLKPGGWLGFEVGAGQGDFLAERMKRTGVYSRMESFRDGEGVIRAWFASV